MAATVIVAIGHDACGPRVVTRGADRTECIARLHGGGQGRAGQADKRQ